MSLINTNIKRNWKKQTCIDINECSEGQFKCGKNSRCVNTIGSYRCSCIRSFQLLSNLCAPMKGTCLPHDGHDYCDLNGKCVATDSNKWSCKCHGGWAGNGVACGLDKDKDGWPDEGLNCIGYGCQKDNCADVPNSDQDDTDGNGIGNACENMCETNPCESGKIRVWENSGKCIKIKLNYIFLFSNSVVLQTKFAP